MPPSDPQWWSARAPACGAESKGYPLELPPFFSLGRMLGEGISLHLE